MTEPNQIVVFDRKAVRAHRDRIAGHFATHDALFEDSADQIVERLADIKQEFRSVLDLGAHDGRLARHFAARGTPLVIAADISEKILRAQPMDIPVVAADEEYLPFAPQSFDLIVSNLSLHWVNDLPGALIQIKNTLKPGGLFLAALMGGDTLYGLRQCMMEAELAVTGGASPRFSPTLTLPTASALLQRAGFSLPVADAEKITIQYPDVFALLHDLRGMGETNAHIERLRHPSRRAVFMEAVRRYSEAYGMGRGRVAAQFELLFLHGTRS